MNPKLQNTQKGITLIVTLIMLVVLSLLVVSAIRFGNTNLKIAGNVQSQSEAVAATQIALERVLEQVKTAPNISAIAASTNDSAAITAGGGTYQVDWTTPSCKLTRAISNAELSPTKASDIPCYESTGGDIQVDVSGAATSSPAACNDQNWEVQASVDDATTGTKVSASQGFSVRVSAGSTCL